MRTWLEHGQVRRATFTIENGHFMSQRSTHHFSS